MQANDGRILLLSTSSETNPFSQDYNRLHEGLSRLIDSQKPVTIRQNLRLYPPDLHPAQRVQ